MRTTGGAVLAFLLLAPVLLAAETQGIFRGDGNEFKIGYALADHDQESGEVRVLLLQAKPEVENLNHHIDRLGAIAKAAPGGFLMVKSAEDGYLNVQCGVKEFGFGLDFEFPGEISSLPERVAGKINGESDGWRLEVTLDAEFLPARQPQGDLATDGGTPGAALIEHMKKVASGDREAIMIELPPQLRKFFASLSAEEQEEVLSSAASRSRQNVTITGGKLYDGYALVTFTAEKLELPVQGKALLSREGDGWRIRDIVDRFEE